MKNQTRFISQKPAKVVLSSMEVVAQSMGFKTHIRNYKVERQATPRDLPCYALLSLLHFNNFFLPRFLFPLVFYILFDIKYVNVRYLPLKNDLSGFELI